MEAKRESVISLYLDGKPQIAIVRALKHLKVNKSFVSRTIARYRDTGSVARRKGSGVKRKATSSEMVRKVKNRIEQNPQCSSRQIAHELNISPRSVQRILQNDLKLKAHKEQKEQKLIDKQEKVRRNPAESKVE